jgi:thioredoxin reductase (NADPH)
MKDIDQENRTDRQPAEDGQSFDVIIIGAGPAGLSAALWCDELGLNALLVESKPECGGQLLGVYNSIENHLGIEAENGRELRDIFVRQTEKRRFTLLLDSEPAKVDLKAKRISLTNGKAFSATAALIIATGVRRRKLDVEGEEEYKNQGIIESGKRDKDSVTGKAVCIVGGGDAALENALILSETAERIFLVHRRAAFRARPEFTEKALENKKVQIFTETAVVGILGDEKIKAVELQDLKTGERFTLPIDAVLLRIGVEPNIELFREDLKLGETGYIEIDGQCQTSMKDVFAIGDVANPLAPTVSSAVGMGATAAKVIFNKLER